MDSSTAPRPREKVRSQKPCHTRTRSLNKSTHLVSLLEGPEIISPLWKRCFSYYGNTSAVMKALMRRSILWRIKTSRRKKVGSTYGATSRQRVSGDDERGLGEECVRDAARSVDIWCGNMSKVPDAFHLFL
jgi:hypothetical protein